MNFLEAYEAYKRGEDVERPSFNGCLADPINFNSVFTNSNKNNIEATNWEIKRKPMKCWEALQRMLEEGKTVANDIRPGARYTRELVMCLSPEELNTSTWYIVSENENENEEKIK